MNYIKEFIKIFSDEPSFFSKKRIESGIAFAFGQLFLLVFFFYNLEQLTTTETIALSTLEFSISGYIINHIQKQKQFK